MWRVRNRSRSTPKVPDASRGGSLSLPVLHLDERPPRLLVAHAGRLLAVDSRSVINRVARASHSAPPRLPRRNRLTDVTEAPTRSASSRCVILIRSSAAFSSAGVIVPTSRGRPPVEASAVRASASVGTGIADRPNAFRSNDTASCGPKCTPREARKRTAVGTHPEKPTVPCTKWMTERRSMPIASASVPRVSPRPAIAARS